MTYPCQDPVYGHSDRTLRLQRHHSQYCPKQKQPISGFFKIQSSVNQQHNARVKTLILLTQKYNRRKERENYPLP